eukprot:gene1716-2059_t
MAEAKPDVEMGDHQGDEDDSSEDEIELSEADQQKIMQLEGQLEANPTVYDTHIQLIDVLRTAKLKERLRTARQRMHALFPFNETQWMDWINDEMDGISSNQDVEQIKQMFQLAMDDYVSVSLWESYLEFLQAADSEVASKTADGAAAFRKVAEEALTAVGLHLAEGKHLWQLYRSYEMGVAEAAPGGDDRNKALEKVRSLFHRQLQLPQPAAAELLQEYEAWEEQDGKGMVPEHIKAAAERSANGAQLRAAHEAAVGGEKTHDAQLLAAYMAYIQLEKAQKDPARLQLLYERAIAAFPVTSELWLQYTKWLEAELKVPSVINKVYARAVRNCPWVGALWAAALRALERCGGTDEQHAALTEKALTAGMQGPEDYMSVLLARADCLRHQLAAQPGDSQLAAKLRAWLSRSSDLMAQYFPDQLDRSLRLPAYWAQLEGQLLSDLAAMRAVWEDTVKGPLGRYHDTWLAWANMERHLRQLGASRSVFKRCYTRKFEEGGQLAMAYEWLRFEREEGSADDLFQASLKAAAQAAKKLSRDEVKAMRRANDPNWKERKPGVKRDHDEGEAAPTKRTKNKDADDAMADAEPPNAPSTSQAVAAEAGGDRVVYTDEHTVFVKGLGFDVDEEDLRRLFEGLGVKAVRMGLDKVTGQRRGFAYVEFNTDDAVSRASEKDGEVLNGRRLFIAKSAPPGGAGRGHGGFAGRGRGRGGFGQQQGRGRDWASDHGGGARGGGGRGRQGLGYGDRGRGGGRRLTNADHAHQRLQLDGNANAGHEDAAAGGQRIMPSAALVPRALISKLATAGPTSPAGPTAANAAAGDRPKSNEDFKKMLQKKGGGA